MIFSQEESLLRSYFPTIFLGNLLAKNCNNLLKQNWYRKNIC